MTLVYFRAWLDMMCLDQVKERLNSYKVAILIQLRCRLVSNFWKTRTDKMIKNRLARAVLTEMNMFCLESQADHIIDVRFSSSRSNSSVNIKSWDRNIGQRTRSSSGHNNFLVCQTRKKLPLGSQYCQRCEIL